MRFRGCLGIGPAAFAIDPLGLRPKLGGVGCEEAKGARDRSKTVPKPPRLGKLERGARLALSRRGYGMPRVVQWRSKGDRCM